MNPVRSSRVLVTLLVLGGCATNPVTGAREFVMLSEAQEIAMGREADVEVRRQMGLYEDDALQRYVEEIGLALASRSHRPELPWSFAIVDSPAINAFAIPGGFIYLTRGIMPFLSDEADLAGVLGHEVGHVAARHSQRRQAASQRNTLLGAAGAILSGILLGNSGIGQQIGQAALQGSQLLTLKFSRSQELEADELGIRYLNSAGYDPRAMGTVLQSLALQNALDARVQGRDNASIPEWASTHPDPASRVQSALSKAQATGVSGGITNRDTFLTRIDGLTYGDDPAQGVVEGRQFIHPELRLAFTAPQGFYMVNGTRAVSVNGQSGQAQFSLAPYNGNLESYVASVFGGVSEQQQIRPQSIQRTTVNGLPAAYGTARVNSGNGQVDVTVFAYEFANDRAYHFVAITPAGNASVFNAMFGSMRRIDSQTAANVIPRVIDVVTVRSGDTVNSLASRMAYSDNQVDRFRVLNGLTSNEGVSAGQKVKLVVRGR